MFNKDIFFKNLCAVLIVLCLANGLTAQVDIHFSQFYAAPLNLNPAMTGVSNCQQRFILNYRNQWASVLRQNSFQTINASYDAKAPAGRYDYFGYGINVYGDQAGSLGFKTNNISANFSYAKQMSGYRNQASYLVVGARVGGVNRGINFTDARWGSQNDGGVFNQNLPSNENAFNKDNFFYADVSAGLLWFNVLDENNNYYIGGAYDHLNRPNVSFSSTAKAVPINSKFTIHVGGEFRMSDRVTMLPGLVTFLQGPDLEVNGGTSLRFNLGNDKRSEEAIQFGLWARIANKFDNSIIGDAIIASTRFDYQNFSIGFSYDVNISSLNVASNGNGGFEFSLLYKVCGKDVRGVYCPNF